jgi:PAS domain S-box-containing protein
MTGQRTDDPHAVETLPPPILDVLATTAGRSLDPGELVKLVARHAGALLHADAVAVYLWDDAAGLLRPIYTDDPRQPRDELPLRAGQGAAGQAVASRRPVLVEDYQHFEHAVEWGLERGVKTVEAVPLLLAERPVGALVIRFYARRPLRGADEERVLQLLAAEAAPALEAARLYATSALEREHERALREITSALAENLDERQVLDLAVRHSAQLMRSPYARVWVLEETGELSCAAAEGYVHSQTYTRRLSRDSLSGRTAHQQLVNLADAPAQWNWFFNRDFGERTGLGAYLGAGLWRAGESLGVLEVMRETGHRFTEIEEQLLISLANAVAVAVSNARTHAAVERLALHAQQRAEAVVESERVLRSVYEAIGSGVLVLDSQGRVVTANAAAQAILGVPAASLIGRLPRMLDTQLHADGSLTPIMQRPVDIAVGTRQAHRKSVFGFARPDGARRWIQLDAVPLFGTDGEVTRVVSSFIDITDQKGSEESLRQRDAILQGVAFAAEKLLSTPEWEQCIDDVLRQLGAATGVSRVYIVPCGEAADDPYEHGARVTPHEWTADGVGRRADMPRHGSYLEAVGLRRWESILAEGGSIEGSLRTFPPAEQIMLAAQGVRSLLVVPIFVGAAWWGFIGFDDCAEERDWPASAVEVLKTAAGTLGASILRRRADAARIQLVREQVARAEAEAAQRRLGFLAEVSEILAKSLDYDSSLQGVADLLVPELADVCFIDVSEADDKLRRVAGSIIDSVEHDARSMEHQIADVLRTGRPMLQPTILTVPLMSRLGPTGALTWAIATHRPFFELSDLDLAEHIARRCALAIESSRLYREARAAVALRDEFLSVAAHELKTPMTSLRGYAQLLVREFDRGEMTDPGRTRRAAVTIMVQSDKLGRLVGQLLDVSRLQSGMLAIEKRSADLSELLREVVRATRIQLRNHILVARLPGELWMSLDPLRIEQVITNLVDNAIKYSPDGGQIDLVLSVDDAGQCVRIVVRDRGVGVPVEHRAHIFDRFYQAHAGGALTSMAGMGLGLYISRQIVEMHNGEIAAEFPADGGTRFVVTLPCHDDG